MTRNIRPLLLITLGASLTAHADSVNVYSGSIGGTSDLVFRGLSLTRGKPAAQASIDVEFPREFYAGAFVATCDPNPGPSPAVEMDVWAGRYWRMSENFSADVRLSQYTYPDDPRRVSYNRTEITGTLGYRNQLFVGGYLLPEHQGAWPRRPGMKKAAPGRWSCQAVIPSTIDSRCRPASATTACDDVYHDSYNYWNVTLTATLKPFELQLAYLGVDDSATEHFDDDAVGDRVAFTALWRFSSTR